MNPIRSEVSGGLGWRSQEGNHKAFKPKIFVYGFHGYSILKSEIYIISNWSLFPLSNAHTKIYVCMKTRMHKTVNECDASK